MGKLIQAFVPPTQTFTREEADKIVPYLLKITEEVSSRGLRLLDEQHALEDQGLSGEYVELQIENCIQGWKDKVEALGLHVRGIWRGVFDTGSYHLCWQYPESKITFRKSYSQTFFEKEPIKD